MTRSSVILHRHTDNIQQTEMNAGGRQGLRSPREALALCSQDAGGGYLRNTSRARSTLRQELSQVKLGQGGGDGKALSGSCHTSPATLCRKVRQSSAALYKTSLLSRGLAPCLHPWGPFKKTAFSSPSATPLRLPLAGGQAAPRVGRKSGEMCVEGDGPWLSWPPVLAIRTVSASPYMAVSRPVQR